MTTKPEAAARVKIDAALDAAGWSVQDVQATNLAAGCGVAIREFPLKLGHGFVRRKGSCPLETEGQDRPENGTWTRFRYEMASGRKRRTSPDFP